MCSQMKMCISSKPGISNLISSINKPWLPKLVPIASRAWVTNRVLTANLCVFVFFRWSANLCVTNWRTIILIYNVIMGPQQKSKCYRQAVTVFENILNYFSSQRIKADKRVDMYAWHFDRKLRFFVRSSFGKWKPNHMTPVWHMSLIPFF